MDERSLVGLYITAEKWNFLSFKNILIKKNRIITVEINYNLEFCGIDKNNLEEYN